MLSSSTNKEIIEYIQSMVETIKIFLCLNFDFVMKQVANVIDAICVNNKIAPAGKNKLNSSTLWNVYNTAINIALVYRLALFIKNTNIEI